MTFTRGINAVNAVESYSNKGFLRATTLFATFHVDDIDAVFSHEQTIQSLDRFLKGPPRGQKKQFSSKISIWRFIHS